MQPPNTRIKKKGKEKKKKKKTYASNAFRAKFGSTKLAA